MKTTSIVLRLLLSTTVLPRMICSMDRLTYERRIKNDVLPDEFRQAAVDGNIDEMNNLIAEVCMINEDIGEFEELPNIVYQQDENGRTPLFHCACYARRNIRATIEFLIWGHVDIVNIPDRAGNTPLLAAANQGNEEAVATLIKYRTYGN